MMTEEDHILLALAEAWIAEEYRKYVRTKFTLQDDINRDFDWWQQQFDNYLHRARTLGVDTPGGRQAVAKFAATAVGMFIAMLHEQQQVPEPGVASGDNFDKEWLVKL